MAEQILVARSAFANWKPIHAAGLTVDVREDLTIASITAARGRAKDLNLAIKSAYGVELPRSPRRVEGKEIAFVWAGADQWMAIAPRGSGRDLEIELMPVTSGLAAVVDHSDGRAVIRVSGRDARAVLAKGLPVDLHPRSFNVGDVAISHASHIGLVLWQLDEMPSYEIAMFRSFANSFADWLREAAAEFVEPLS